MTVSQETAPAEQAVDPSTTPILSAVERIKAGSSRLRGSLALEIADGSARFSNESGQLLKFHGIYQQDDRDHRRALRSSKQELAYSCMVRCAVPGGVLSRSQWLDIDRLAGDVADGALRLTSRQGVQYHFVHKGELQRLVSSLNHGLVTTYAACGDVVRNVMVSPVPAPGRDGERVADLAQALADRLRPASGAYWELWLDGDKAVSAHPKPSRTSATAAGPDPAEPLYGETYLPRKFKIGVTWPGDNSIDVYSQDLGFVLMPDSAGRPGAAVLAGGGLGRSHNDPSTFPRLAEPMAWVPEQEIGEVAEAVVTVFRDYGNREDRSHARLKYVVADRGIPWLREQVEHRLGRQLAEPVSLPTWRSGRSYLGWHQQGDGRWFLGLPVPTGRLTDTDQVARRTAVRDVVQRYADHVRLTPQQDMLLCGITPADRPAVDELLAHYGVPQAAQLPLTVLSSMACPALPTCGQALGEAERILPELTDLLDRLLGDRGLDSVSIETRMTGCPNGCSRPYVAELGIVGRTKTTYDLFVGGDPAGTRLATLLTESVPFQKLGDVLGPLLDRYRVGRLQDEAFGDWANRLGTAALAEGLPVFARTSTKALS